MPQKNRTIISCWVYKKHNLSQAICGMTAVSFFITFSRIRTFTRGVYRYIFGQPHCPALGASPMRRTPRSEIIRRVEGPKIVDGKSYPYVYLTRIGSRGALSIRRFKLKHPSSVHLLEQSPEIGWEAFIPRWCTPHNPKRFLSMITKDNNQIHFRVQYN